MKKLLIFLTAAALAVCGGCAEKSESTSDETAVSSSAVEEGKFDFYNTVGNMKICGQDVSLPCKFSEFGTGFELSTPIEDKVNGWMFTSLYYGGNDVGTIYLELRSDGNYDEAQIVSLILGSKSEASLNGATLESSEDDIIKALGENYVKNDFNIDYGSEKKGLVRILMNSVTNTPSSFTIVMPK